MAQPKNQPAPAVVENTATRDPFNKDRKNVWTSIFDAAGAFFEKATGQEKTFDKGALNGVKQIPLANVMIPIVGTSSYFGGVKINMRIHPNPADATKPRREVVCVWPSTPGNIYNKVLNTRESEQDESDLIETSNVLLNGYKKWRNEAKAAGKLTDTPMARGGYELDDEEAAALGLLKS